jgi:hypothetical protein
MSSDEEIAASVEKHGWHGIAVQGTADEPSFVYSIGFCRSFKQPDVIIFSLDPKVAFGVLVEMVADFRAGKVYRAGNTYEGLLLGCGVSIRPVHPTQRGMRMGYGVGYYRHVGQPEAFEAVQLFWPDKAGHFPYELVCDPDVAHVQPRLELAVPPSELRAFYKRFGGST